MPGCLQRGRGHEGGEVGLQHHIAVQDEEAIIESVDRLDEAAGRIERLLLDGQAQRRGAVPRGDVGLPGVEVILSDGQDAPLRHRQPPPGGSGTR